MMHEVRGHRRPSTRTVGPLGVSLALIAAGAVGVALLTACTTDPEARAENLVVAPVRLPDGRTVYCVSNGNTHRGGISCDWAGAERPE